MGYIKQENKFISYLIILFSLFILFLITLNQYKLIQLNLDQKTELEEKIDEKKSLITGYNEISKRIKLDDNVIDKYLVDIKDNEIIDYIYSYVEDTNSDVSTINIQNLSISEGKKNELGFSELDLDLSIIVSNEEAMKRILDFFVSPQSKYNFIIDNFTYPNDERTGSFNVDIPLKIFYK